MKRLLIVSAALEIPTGVALLSAPSMLVAVLLGSELDTPAGVALGRVAGAALLSLGVACWLARGDGASGAARGLVSAMLIYNLAATGVVLYAALGTELAVARLWPAIALHAALAVWCIVCLRARHPSTRSVPSRNPPSASSSD